MFYSSQSFDSILRGLSSPTERYFPFGGIFLPPNLCPLRRELSKSESAVETPTTTSDERLSSPFSSNRSFSTSPTPIRERIGNWHKNSANETPIWRREETKGIHNGRNSGRGRRRRGRRSKRRKTFALQTATNWVVPPLSMAQKNDDDDVTTTAPTDEKW